MEIGDRFVLRNNFYAGTKMAARDDFMREYAIVKYGLPEVLPEVPPGSARTTPSKQVAPLKIEMKPEQSVRPPPVSR